MLVVFILDNSTVPQDDVSAAEFRQFRIVGDKNDGSSFFIQILKQYQYVVRSAGVQISCGFVGENDDRVVEVRYKGKSIADVLDMTINQAVEFFENVPDILRKIKTIQDVGLGYIKVGQPSTTLSGGESQRIKLAAELSKRDTGKTVYILDEPTTGLHFEDIRILMLVLQKLVDRGNTVIIIEHNLDVIRQADWIIDMGPEGGRNGGQILSVGTPEEVAKSRKGYTPQFIASVLQSPDRDRNDA